MNVNIINIINNYYVLNNNYLYSNFGKTSNIMY